MSIVDKLTSRGLITPPPHLKTNIHYECMMGSIAYGCSNDASDCDIYGFSIPPKDIIFPHINGYIIGFGRQPKKFEQYQQHHIKDETFNKEYDITIYNIVKYFQLVMQNNPNMVDSLFVPRRCILHSTAVGERVRERRRLFLTKKAWHTFKGYAYSQLNKCKNKNIHEFVKQCNKMEIDYHISMEDFNEEAYKYDAMTAELFRALYSRVHQSGKITKRLDVIAKHGYDVKFAYHIVRLLNEVEQILVEQDLDLERNREQLKSIRRGDWTLPQIEKYFAEKELALEKTYTSSSLRHSPNEEGIKELLLECLEMHYGSLDKCVVQPNKAIEALKYIEQIATDTLRKQEIFKEGMNIIKR